MLPPPCRDPALEGRSALLVLSRRVTQAQLHAFLARLHKVAPRLFRLWWLKPDALVPTLLAAEARTLRAAGLQSGAQIEMRLAAPVRGGMDCTGSKQTALDPAEIEVKGKEESGAHTYDLLQGAAHPTPNPNPDPRHDGTSRVHSQTPPLRTVQRARL